jgi:hypothetical protein
VFQGNQLLSLKSALNRAIGNPFLTAQKKDAFSVRSIRYLQYTYLGGAVILLWPYDSKRRTSKRSLKVAHSVIYHRNLWENLTQFRRRGETQRTLLVGDKRSFSRTMALFSYSTISV